MAFIRLMSNINLIAKRDHVAGRIAGSYLVKSAIEPDRNCLLILSVMQIIANQKFDGLFDAIKNLLLF